MMVPEDIPLLIMDYIVGVTILQHHHCNMVQPVGPPLFYVIRGAPLVGSKGN